MFIHKPRPRDASNRRPASYTFNLIPINEIVHLRKRKVSKLSSIFIYRAYCDKVLNGWNIRDLALFIACFATYRTLFWYIFFARKGKRKIIQHLFFSRILFYTISSRWIILFEKREKKESWLFLNIICRDPCVVSLM